MLDTSRFNELIQRTGTFGVKYADWQLQWLEEARPKQLPPPGDWDTWMCLAGRGWGKTRVGAEWTGGNAIATPKSRWAVLAPTQNDCRSVCFEGESGLINKIPEYFIKKGGYNRSLLELELVTGSLIVGRSAEKPDRLRGPQWHGAWGDELASWGASAAGTGGKENNRLTDTWDNLIFGLRLGKRPRVLVTTTPRPLKFLRDLKAHERTVVSAGATWENKNNLAPSAIRAMREAYEGTRRGAQELQGIILDDIEGALWNGPMLERLRVADVPADVTLERTVIAVDPAVTSAENSDEWGVVAGSLGSDGHIYVLDDWSGVKSPREAARDILLMYQRFEADCIVAEVNQGGDLVGATLRAEAAGEFFHYKTLRAKKGKYLRAEPAAAYYEKAKVHHVGRLNVLESQMVNFTGSTGGDSPDRLDALVYLILELMSGSFKHEFY